MNLVLWFNEKSLRIVQIKLIVSMYIFLFTYTENKTFINKNFNLNDNLKNRNIDFKIQNKIEQK